MTDVCGERDLGRRFDRIFSVDTLEHVDNPPAFFRFIARHLEGGGEAVVIFPNERENGRHGITGFTDWEELERMIRNSGLRPMEILEIHDTLPHRLIRAFLWTGPRALAQRFIMGKGEKADEQTFDRTLSFRLNVSHGPTRLAAIIHSGFVRALAGLFPLYRSNPLIPDGDFQGKRLLLRLVRVKSDPDKVAGK